MSIPSWAGGSWGAEDELGGPRALVVLVLGCNANTPMHPAWDAGTGSRDTSWDLGGCSLGPPSSLQANPCVEQLSPVLLIFHLWMGFICPPKPVSPHQGLILSWVRSSPRGQCDMQCPSWHWLCVQLC